MNIHEFLSSGILEQYVLGSLTKEESLEVERMAALHPDVKTEIENISRAIEQLAMANAVAPDKNIKPFLMATIDYMERVEHGEEVLSPPLLNENSQLVDFAKWLNREDMILPLESEDPYAKIIGSDSNGVTAIVWLKEGSPAETHHNEYEKFLVVEGTCDILIEDDVHHLTPGDFFAIPLHKAHVIRVTSDFPCKVILQRTAA